MKTLVDTNVLLDIVTRDPTWSPWSEAALRGSAEHATLIKPSLNIAAP